MPPFALHNPLAQCIEQATTISPSTAAPAAVVASPTTSRTPLAISRTPATTAIWRPGRCPAASNAAAVRASPPPPR